MPRWTQETKRRQRELIEQQRPWARSCGPKSHYGKLVASQNARKHRRRSHVTLVSPDGIKQQLSIGDVVRYVGGYQPTFDICQGLPLKVVGFDEAAGAICEEQQRFAIACRTAGGKLIWIYPQDLERV